MQDGALNVPDEPVVHYIEGDGIGIDITPVMINVVNASVAKAYDGSKQIHWSEVLAGEKAFTLQENGFQRPHSMPCAAVWFPSRDH